MSLCLLLLFLIEGTDTPASADTGTTSPVCVVDLLPLGVDEALGELVGKLYDSSAHHEYYTNGVDEFGIRCDYCKRKNIQCASENHQPISISSSDPGYLGRNRYTCINCLKISQDLGVVTLTPKTTDHGAVTANVTMHLKDATSKDDVFLNGKRFLTDGVRAGDEVQLENDDIISLFGPTLFAYKVVLRLS